MPEFIPGLDLSRRFYEQVVRALIEDELGDIPYAAGLLGAGSDVLGFDTERSTDHDWGPRLTVLLPDELVDTLAPQLHERLCQSLPHSFLGYSVDFGALFAAVVITIIPVLVVYVIFQRQLQGSVSQSTVK